jgi:signal transduction histidine kinase
LEEDDNYVLFSVINQGTPISDEDINRIGERFFRTDKARNRATGGTGLGLSIVKEIVRLHNGTFTIESNTSDGTNVLIQLPKWKEEDFNEKT